MIKINGHFCADKLLKSRGLKIKRLMLLAMCFNKPEKGKTIFFVIRIRKIKLNSSDNGKIYLKETNFCMHQQLS